ncbi:MAG TPA: antitoxin Xre/MbcA/ParS toxin-binding domain-containing protein [Acetobacteraceae bacterium]|nr:antitoxin Xre/MbcA/ParS toxin-binding domain-containing protein [Acetobacteraceae bacterium]
MSLPSAVLARSASSLTGFAVAEGVGIDDGETRLAGAVRQGLPMHVVDSVLERHILTLAEIDRLAVPRKTLTHRRTLGRLSAEQSDRLLRVLRVIRAAEVVFGDPGKAHRWLRRPTEALGGSPPLDLLDTDAGTRRVETLLGQIDHGIPPALDAA